MPGKKQEIRGTYRSRSVHDSYFEEGTQYVGLKLVDVKSQSALEDHFICISEMLSDALWVAIQTEIERDQLRSLKNLMLSQPVCSYGSSMKGLHQPLL